MRKGENMVTLEKLRLRGWHSTACSQRWARTCV